MIKLFEQDIKTLDRQSSKGMQLKWCNNDIWYKSDYTGCEGLVEYIISKLLIKSTLKSDEYTVYDTVEIEYKNRILLGCMSESFLPKEWQIITLEKLFKNHYGQGLNKSIYSIEGYEERVRFIAKQTERITGLKNFGNYLSKLFAIDAFFLNEDRHTHNIAVLIDDENNYHYCPIFDNGASLLADTRLDYPLGEDIIDLIKTVKSKTVSTDFDDQLDAVEREFGNQIKFLFDKKYVEDLLEKEKNYPREYKERIKEIIFLQMNKYQYLFK